jgi:hypothetical protein
VLCRGSGRSLATYFVKTPRWWSGACGDPGKVFPNKRFYLLLWSCQILLMLPSPLAGRGGTERGSMSVKLCTNRGGGGDLELIHVGGVYASTTLCWQGGRISTSGEEALHRSRRGCLKLSCYEVIRSPWLGSGPWPRIIAARGLPSSRSLFLGGDVWRTPATSGRGAQGLHCKFFICSRVLYVKRRALSLDRRFPRTRIVGAFLQFVPANA